MNIDGRLKKLHFFKIKPDLSYLDQEAKKALTFCVKASDVLTDIYLDQAYAGNRNILSELQKRDDQEGKDLLRYFLIHGSPWDAKRNSFISGVGKKPKFGSFYPFDLTKEEWDSWLKAHPEDRDDFENHYTVIKRQNDSLVAEPYSKEYGDRLKDAAGYLRQAASFLPAGFLKSFLDLRAEAFLSNDYFKSDIAWVDTDGNPFEVTIGPYEVYFDEMLGLKAAFKGFIASPDKDATAALGRFMPHIPEFARMISEEFGFRQKGKSTPLLVVNDIMRGGEAKFGYMFIAYNLPNDWKVCAEKGTKNIFSRTMMEAKFSNMTFPIVERLFPEAITRKCTFENRLWFVAGHEFAHGFGPASLRVDGREVPFEAVLQDLHSALEETKADMLGVRLLGYFKDKGLFDDGTLIGILAAEVASYFQMWRNGFSEAHARANLIEYNWLKAKDVLRYSPATKKYEIDFERCLDAMSSLGNEIIKLQMAGDYNLAKDFVERWSSIPSEIPSVLERLSGISEEVIPVWDLSELK